MADDYPIADARRAEIVEQTQRYIETGGAEGHTRNGLSHLVLTTTGRRSGEQRSTTLIYGTDGDRYLVVASLGGYDRAPYWYLNLTADPQVTVQVMDDRFEGLAVTAGADERPRLWALMAQIFPTYDDYQAKTDREIPVVILRRR